MSTYITQSGDTWDVIAYKVYKKESLMTSLLAANPDHASTVVFSSNVKIEVPDMPVNSASSLPPWKRGRS
ncbi:tail protein X [Paenibacillus sp. CGMCC 1.16610]|uniref:Phage tail protein n=1 Tax=Paenibacillus anseongense TaxID=2682845 RepID=A0ABW9U2N7_9BACL|nr:MULTISPECIES: tail protein X [Paenibacillus]MBA2943216.1 tail protein X [Paenibacillus sp. CGMCC 1.16610]MEC0269055.1 tail protein X [Paenibacillus anseongense]MVQ33713.1 phage tail protein [Paenibacillus anseongense]